HGRAPSRQLGLRGLVLEEQPHRGNPARHGDRARRRRDRGRDRAGAARRRRPEAEAERLLRHQSPELPGPSRLRQRHRDGDDDERLCPRHRVRRLQQQLPRHHRRGGVLRPLPGQPRHQPLRHAGEVRRRPPGRGGEAPPGVAAEGALRTPARCSALGGEMTTVETALGPVATTELGPTLMHEHVVTRSPGVQENWPHLWDRNAILTIAERKMADLYTRGIRSIVDLTTVDLGRDIGLIVDVARRSRVHVIVATGVWWMPQRYFSAHGVDAVAELFIRDITRGIGTSGVKAAIIKCATDTAGVTPVLEHFLPTAKRVEVLARLCAEGYAGKMVLSHDANCWTDMLSEDDKRRTRPLWHYNHIPDDILPALRKAGVTADQIEQMLVRNPR